MREAEQTKSETKGRIIQETDEGGGAGRRFDNASYPPNRPTVFGGDSGDFSPCDYPSYRVGGWL